ncbi:NfeD family protein [Ancylomarina longa]|uniref:NfeD family protein n=1 Tax=Ancylomarina longa TaxID=2487017 RepID=A0A434AUI6_9BACT|nr:NfeD family protein [Ancylomarina longa]RUT78006.1 NfeD family protein [Ancylomarina longa]
MEFNIWYLWFTISVSLFVLEIIISSYTAVCIGLGALVAGTLSFLGADIGYQVVSFIGISGVFLFFIKFYYRKHLISRSYQPISNLNDIVGKDAYVMEEINPVGNHGKVIFSGETWKARSEFGEVISKGEFVKIIDTDVRTVTVKK